MKRAVSQGENQIFEGLERERFAKLARRNRSKRYLREELQKNLKGVAEREKEQKYESVSLALSHVINI